MATSGRPEAHDIVERASAVLAAERAGRAPHAPGDLPDPVGAVLVQGKNPVIERFRTQMQAVVETVTELVVQMAAGGGAPSPAAVSPAAPVGGAGPRVLEELVARAVVPPGAVAEVPVAWTNHGAGPVSTGFVPTPLVSGRGYEIPAAQIRFDPPTLRLGAGEAGGVTVRVHVPPQTRAGTYRGLVQSAESAQVPGGRAEPLAAVVTIHVS